ncbi:MAG: hypothetical protein FWC81_00255 [Coriobacteriia bacterium]|nr:hypothetical protein [Coriobacteriia bacterium]
MIQLTLDSKFTATSLQIAGIVTFALGTFFLVAGTATMLGLAYPESRDLAIAQNQDLPVQMAVVTQPVRTNSTLNGVTMYRAAFEWDGKSAQTNPVYTQAEAEDMVGTTIQIRVTDSGRAIPVDYERSLYSILGWIFMGAFGGSGAFMLLIALVLSRIRKSIIKQAEPNQKASTLIHRS